MNHKSKGIEKEKKNQECRNYDYEVWLKLFLEYLFFVELEDMSSQNVAYFYFFHFPCP